MSHYMRDIFWTGRGELKGDHYDDEARRQRHDEGLDPWGYDEDTDADRHLGTDMGQPEGWLDD